jgi:HAD superfamily hydrolase (TIGR01450 family)
VAEPAPLAAGYGAVVLDLDGVVYLGEEVVPAAPQALKAVRGLGVRVGFVTNNSWRPPAAVAGKLDRLGVEAATGEVLTSAQAAVRMLGGPEALRGTPVLVVGGEGLRGALAKAGARLLDPADWRQAAVVAVGVDLELTYDKARAAALAIRAGARFVGSNPDTTFPTPEGLWPGAGAMLALLQTATGVPPEVAGKPEAPLFEAAAAALGDGPYLMVGDRGDTDLAGAGRLGWATALVLSGVTRPGGLLDVPVVPDHLLADVGGLLDPPGPAVRPPADDGERDAAAGLLGAAADGLLVAAVGRRVVGAAGWRADGTAGRLLGPVVEPGWRGRLVGSRLALAAAVALRAAGARRITAQAGDAGGFLARLGFHGDAEPTRDLPAGRAQR